MIFLFYKDKLEEICQQNNIRIFQIFGEFKTDNEKIPVIIRGSDVVKLFKKIIEPETDRLSDIKLETICWYNPVIKGLTLENGSLFEGETFYDPINITLFAKKFKDLKDRYVLEVGGYLE